MAVTEPELAQSLGQDAFLLRGRVVWPVTRPPLADGAVLVSHGRVAQIDQWSKFDSHMRNRTIDLREVILLPGLVNAHCHLDYTNLAGEFGPPSVFTDWLKLITTAKSFWTYSDYAESWITGARMLARTGTTMVADIEAVPELLPDVWSATPLRVWSFLEMTGIRSRRAPETILQEAIAHIDSLPSGRCRLALSPHAPYSTLPELLRLSAATAKEREWPLTTHVAESAEEYEMFSDARGAMFDWLQRSGRDVSDCGHGSPVMHLESCGCLAPNLLAVHANYLGRSDVSRLARHGVHVVHCPRSHAFFRHAEFPLKRLRRAGVNICLGTDSLASVEKPRRQSVELSLFEEMRILAARSSGLSSQSILRMATVNGAKALGLAGRAGEICPGAWADLIAIPYAGKVAGVADAVVNHCGPVSASMVGGDWVIPPGP
jgi:cytosine/adenosine deaminase-related metal-dependent hydrolase